jgi:hypothetical protein
MGYNPFLVVAIATWTELSSEEAQEFFKTTALQHFGLLVFVTVGVPFILFEAGQKTRTLVNSWHTTEAVSEPAVTPEVAPETDAVPPLATTEAIATNPEITIEEIYVEAIQDSVIQDGEGDFSASVQDDPTRLELVSEPISDQPEDLSHPETSFVIVTHHEPKASASSDTGQTDNQKTKGRVPRSRGKVSAE